MSAFLCFRYLVDCIESQILKICFLSPGVQTNMFHFTRKANFFSLYQTNCAVSLTDHELNLFDKNYYMAFTDASIN